MTFPTASTLDNMLSIVQNEARRLKTIAADLKAQSLSGPISADAITAFFLILGSAKARFASASAVTGLGAYAQDQLGSPALDIAAEFTAMTTQIDATISWIMANFPGSGGYVLKEQLAADGTITVRQFSTAALAAFRAQLDALTATIG